jgi:MFS family permease
MFPSVNEDPTRLPPGRARGLLRSVAVDRTPFKVSRDYKRLWWSTLISQGGSQITIVAVFFQVYKITGSAAAVGIVGLVQFVPLTLATTLGGPLIDRLDRRKILLVTRFGLAGCSSVLLLGALLHPTPLWIVYVAVAFSAAFGSVASPAQTSVIANIIPVELLSSAVALNQLMWNAAQVAGPALGGIIIARAGLAWAYGIDVITFAATIYVTFLLSPQVPKVEPGAEPTVGVRAIREAFSFVRGRPILQATFIVDLVAMIFGMPRALFPILAIKQFHRGAEVVGGLFSAIAIGAVLGASTAGWVRKIKRQGAAVLIAVTLWGAGIALFGLIHSLVAAFFLLAAAGAADVISAVFRGTILQTTVTDAVRGRLTAIHLLVVTGGPRLGDLEAGLVASAFTPTISVVSGGLACIAGVGLIALLMPQFARYEASEGQAP